jgi:hypothetical protein
MEGSSQAHEVRPLRLKTRSHRERVIYTALAQGFPAGVGVVGACDGRGARLRAGAGAGCCGGDSEFL